MLSLSNATTGLDFTDQDSKIFSFLLTAELLQHESRSVKEAAEKSSGEIWFLNAVPGILDGQAEFMLLRASIQAEFTDIERRWSSGELADAAKVLGGIYKDLVCRNLSLRVNDLATRIPHRLPNGRRKNQEQLFSERVSYLYDLRLEQKEMLRQRKDIFTTTVTALRTIHRKRHS